MGYWQLMLTQDVSRLEAEKLAMMAEFQAERVHQLSGVARRVALQVGQAVLKVHTSKQQITHTHTHAHPAFTIAHFVVVNQ